MPMRMVQGMGLWRMSLADSEGKDHGEYTQKDHWEAHSKEGLQEEFTGHSQRKDHWNAHSKEGQKEDLTRILRGKLSEQGSLRTSHKEGSYGRAHRRTHRESDGERVNGTPTRTLTV